MCIPFRVSVQSRQSASRALKLYARRHHDAFPRNQPLLSAVDEIPGSGSKIDNASARALGGSDGADDAGSVVRAVVRQAASELRIAHGKLRNRRWIRNNVERLAVQVHPTRAIA